MERNIFCLLIIPNIINEKWDYWCRDVGKQLMFHNSCLSTQFPNQIFPFQSNVLCSRGCLARAASAMQSATAPHVQTACPAKLGFQVRPQICLGSLLLKMTLVTCHAVVHNQGRVPLGHSISYLEYLSISYFYFIALQ